MTRASNLAIFASSPPTVNSTLLTIGANVSVNATTLSVGNSTVNAIHTSSLIKVANSTGIANLTATSLNIGSSTVNASALAIGANVFVSTTGFLVGNSSVNTNITAGSFTQTGDMGIGTSSPARKFDVAGGARFLQDTSATTGAVVLRQNSGDTVGGHIQWVNNSNNTEKGWLVVDTSSNMLFATGSTERARISSTGGFSVGTTAAPGSGAIYATGNITAYYSDERLKENITPITNALDKVNSITGVTYNSNDLAAEYGFTDRSQQVGVLAQEIQQILPEAVKHAPFDMAAAEDGSTYSKSGETYLTVQYEKLVPLLIEAIKELTDRVKELESK